MLCKLLVLSVILAVVSSQPDIEPDFCIPVHQYPFTEGEEETYLRLSESVGYNREKALKIIEKEYSTSQPAGFLEKLQAFYDQLDVYAKEEAAYYNIGIKYLKAAIHNPEDKCVTYTPEVYKRLMLKSLV